MKAKAVLADCKKARALLEIERDAQTFRILLVSAMTLCRAIGHVLKNVDACENPKLKGSIELWWKTIHEEKDAHEIFHDFIDRHRNLILKEYQFLHDDSDQSFTILPAKIHVPLEPLIFCPITDGVFAGNDCRDVLSDAINWWEKQLSLIEGRSADDF